MRYVTVPGFDRKLSQIVLGGRFGEQDPALSYALLDAFTQLGGNAIDTARSYADGASERLLGSWFKRRGKRDDIILIDKGCHPTSTCPERVTPACIEADISESLQALERDSIDIYLLHRDDERMAVGALLEQLNDEVRRGRIRAFGASNWRIARLREAEAYARSHGALGFCLSSCGFNLAVPNQPMWPGTVMLDQQAVAWHQRSAFPLLAWSSQARGWFAGAYASGARSDKDVTRVYESAENRQRLLRARELATQRGVSATQIALAYVLCQPFPTMALIGPESLEELYDAMGALAIELSQEERSYLANAPGQARTSAPAHER